MDQPRSVARHLLATAALTVIAAIAACSHAPVTPPPALPVTKAVIPSAIPAATLPAQSDAATLTAIDRAIADPLRSSANRLRDPARHPRETLEFFGLRSDMTVMEVWPGANGWYAEILAPLLRDRGRYVAAEHDPFASAYAQNNVRALKEKFEADPATYGKAEITSIQAPTALAPVPPNTVDLVVTFRNLHNWLAKPDMAPAMLKAIYAALKPGGTLGIVDHRADPTAPVDPLAKLGYVNEAYAIDLVKQAGFEFVAASEINANPRDTRDYEQGVWTLPPTFRLGDKDRERYISIGESDRFTLRFRKPLHGP